MKQSIIAIELLKDASGETQGTKLGNHDLLVRELTHFLKACPLINICRGLSARMMAMKNHRDEIHASCKLESVIIEEYQKSKVSFFFGGITNFFCVLRRLISITKPVKQAVPSSVPKYIV